MKHPTPYLKMRVLGAIETAGGDTIIARIKNVSQTDFTDEEGFQRRFTWRTIQTWYSRFKKHGVTVMENTPRSDRGKTRKLDQAQLAEAVRAVLPSARPGRGGRDAGPPKIALLYRLCLEKGLLARSQIAPNTFNRLVRQLELLKDDGHCENRRRMAFAKPYANDLWQADTLFGPHIKTAGGPAAQTCLIAFVDDASRVCCHGEFFTRENVDTLIAALRAALYKRGIPAAMLVDNGSIYISNEITQICARLGCILHHAPIHDGAAKGKVERFFRTVRDQFLSRQLDLSTLEALNRQFTHWVEEHYNAQKHSILGMSPLERFALDRNRIRFLPPNENSDELFFAEHERHVRADNTFNFHGARYEAPRHLPNRKIQIRHQRSRKKDHGAPVIV